MIGSRPRLLALLLCTAGFGLSGCGVAVVGGAIASASGGGGGSGASGGGVGTSGSGAPVSPTPSPTPTPTPAPTPSPSPTPTPPPAPIYALPVAPPAGHVITPSTSQPTRSANDTAEYRRNYNAAEYVNALFALDNGWQGQGVTVAVVDDGVMNVGGELSGRIDLALSRDFGTVTAGGTTTARNVLGDTWSKHGTAVANIIAGAADGVGAMGLAPRARIAALRVDHVDLDENDSWVEMSADAFDHIAANRIKVTNLSSGAPDPLVAGSLETLAWKAIGDRIASFKGLLVQSAGNDGDPNPVSAPALAPSNRDSWLLVVAVAPTPTGPYALASYSNKAGSAMDRVVAAPGTNVTTKVDGQVSAFSGTSSAAPVVSALAATILSKWPQLTGAQAGDVILATATDIGAPGVDPVFGRGLVNFRAALSPVNPTLSNGNADFAVTGSSMGVPAAAGVAGLRSALSGVTVLDQFGRDFSGSVAGLVVRPEQASADWLRRRLGAMAGGDASLASGRFTGRIGFASERVGPGADQVWRGVTAGSAGYLLGRTGLRAGWNADVALQSDVMGLAPFADGVLAYAPQAANSFGVDRYLAGGKVGVTVSAGRRGDLAGRALSLGWSGGATDLRLAWVDEQGSILGMPVGAGALRLGSGATTALVELHRRWATPLGWALEGYASAGATQIKIDGASLVTGATPLIATRLGLQASGPALGGLLSFGVAQPLVIDAGRARLTYATGYDAAARALVYGSTSASLVGQRRIQLTAGFARGGPRSSLRVGVAQGVGRADTRSLLGYQRKF